MGRDDLAAAILVGGQSRRMGENKALLRLDPSGPTVIESVARTLRTVTSDITLVGSTTADYAFLGLPRIPDSRPASGALGGVFTALSTSACDAVLVVACDMPFLSAGLLRYMASLPREYDVLIPVTDRPQPLHAIYSRSALPLISASLDSGNYRATSWLAEANVRRIERSTLELHDPRLLSSFNMNTPADVDFAKQVLADMNVANAKHAAPQ